MKLKRECMWVVQFCGEHQQTKSRLIWSVRFPYYKERYLGLTIQKSFHKHREKRASLVRIPNQVRIWTITNPPFFSPCS